MQGVNYNDKLLDNMAVETEANEFKTQSEKTKSKKRTKEQEDELYAGVIKAYHDGIPPQDMASTFKVRLNVIDRLLVKMFNESKCQDLIIPKYDVVKSGLAINKLHYWNEPLGEFVRVEKLDNGNLLLKPYSQTVGVEHE